MSEITEPASSVPNVRVRRCTPHPVRSDGSYVVYWMTAARRLKSNYSLQRALDWCDHLQLPLLIFEPIGCRARWNNDRFHTFILEGMRDTQAACVKRRVAYLPYAEPKPGAAKAVILQLADQAAVIVTDDYPCYIIPAMIAGFSRQATVLLEAVDGNGLWPMRVTEQVFPTAYVFRRFLQKNLSPHLKVRPQSDPFLKRTLRSVPQTLWTSLQADVKPVAATLLTEARFRLDQLPIDHTVGRAAFTGGETAAAAALQQFLAEKLHRYEEYRNDPDDSAASRLSPYLHFGHLGAHQIFSAVTEAADWSPTQLAATTSGAKAGWWNLSPNAEAFLDELITWRELGFNFCSHRDDYDQFSSLPDWARKTLKKHAGDSRPVVYSAAQLEAAETGDELWNAAQRQLVREGWMHNYLRMLWGKKILEWSASPEEAFEILIDLNNKYAVDGRDPNSYSGICWIFGRYDRAWGPERPIFGTIRYMSSANTARKLSVKQYLQRYAAEP